MSNRNDSNKKILLDSDVIRHLIKADRLSLLSELYSDRLIILDVVKNELLRSPQLIMKITNFIKFSHIKEMPFPVNRIDVLKEFAILKKRFGNGESACMALARFDNNIIASSNLKDIKRYCKIHNIEYLTTMDILLEGYQQSKFTKNEADAMIRLIKEKKSKLPVDSIDEYINITIK